MRNRRNRALLGALAASIMILTAGGAPVDAASEPATGVQPAAALRAAPPASCRDKLPPNASIAPGSIGLDAGSWPAGSTMKKIQDQGFLRVATNGDVSLWGSTDTDTGNPVGYDVDLATAIAKELGVSLRYTVIPFSQRQNVLKDNRVDLVAQQMTITCDRWQGTAKTATADAQPGINFSTPYYTSGARLLVRRDFGGAQAAALKGRGTVCGAKGSSSLASLSSLGLRTTTATSTGLCLVKFMEGEAVAVVGDATTLAGFKKQDPSSKIIGDTIASGQYGLGLQPGAADFTRYVNALLDRFRSDGTLDALYTTWMRPVVGGSAPRIPAPVYGRNISALGNRTP